MTEKTNIRIARRQDYRKLRFAFFRFPRLFPFPPFRFSLAFYSLPLLSLFLTIISCLLPAASPLYSAEFEVVDRFSVNNYSEFRGSVTIKGSMLDVQSSAQFGSAAKSTFTASGSLNLAPGAALTFSAGAIGDGLIYGQDIAVSTITLDRLNQSGCSPNQIPKWNGTAWSCGTDSGGSGEYVLKAGDAMSGPLTLNGSSLTVVNSLGADRYSLAVTTAADRSVYHLFVATTGNVGIGTASPGAKLEVSGKIINSVTDTGIDRATQFTVNHAAAGNKYGMVLNALGASTTNYGLYVYAGGATTNYGVYSAGGTNYFDGNVGIGTAGLNYPLDVQGVAARNAPLVNIQTTGAAGGNVNVDQGLVVDIVGNTVNANILNLKNAGTSRLVVKELGNVGIGTTIPGAKLEIYKAGALTANPVAVYGEDDNNGATNNVLNFGYTSLFIANNYDGSSPTVDGTKVAKITLYTVTSNGYNAGASIHAVSEGISYNAGALVFATGWDSSNLATERMRINRVGNVGIGTTGPNERLDVDGRIRIESIVGSGSVNLFVTVTGSPDTCNSACGGAACLSAFTSAGVTSTCATSLTTGRCLCSSFGS